MARTYAKSRIYYRRAESTERLQIKWLAVAGICIALAATIAVGFYEVLLRLEG